MKKMLEFLRRTALGLAFVLVLLSSTSTDAATWHVKPTGSDANTGDSWGQAFKTVNKALASAASGDQIWVAAGTYFPDEGPGVTNDDRTAAFVMKNGVEILGGFPATGSPGLAQRNWTANPTILSGDIGTVGDNGDNSLHVVFNSLNGLNATAILDGFTITDGRADGGDFYDKRGGGMQNRSSSPNIRNCTFLENRAISGCGMYNESASPTVTNCLFSSNSTLVFGTGGGMFNIEGASPMLSNCVFDGNTANTGGGLSNEGCSPTAVNCVFSGNAASNGGGMHNNAASPTVVNCSFYGNSAGEGGALRNDYSSFPMLSNCIIWGNNSGISNRQNAAPVVSYSIVQGGYSGTGNLDLDPLFVDAANENFRLQICSPAINAGNNAAVPSGIMTDLVGNPRFFNSGTVDMGAYEYQGVPTPIIAGCKDQTVSLNSVGTGTLAVSALNNGSSGCGTLSFTVGGQTSLDFTCSNIGSTQYTLTVTDARGKTATCTANIMVQDKIWPSVSCKMATVTLGSNNSASIAPADVFQSGSDNCGTVQPISVSPNTFNCSNVNRPNTVFLLATDGNGNSSACSASVTVRSAAPPTVTCKNYTVFLSGSGTASVQPEDVFESGSDACGPVNPMFVSPGWFTCANIGQNTVTLTAGNGNSNTGTCTATVTVQDNTPPSVTCKNHTVALSAAGTASIVPANVFQSGSDNCGTVNPASVSPNSFNCTNIGQSTVTLTVNDGNGNTNTCTATVTVQDNTPPSVTCKNHTVALSAAGTASIVPTNVFQTGSDNCGTVNLVSVSPNSFTCANLSQNTVTLTVNDGNGNTNTCTATVTVQDNIPPTATCKNHTVALSAAGTASVVPTNVFQSGSDNCGTVNPASVSPNSFNCTNIGQSTVTLTVNDGNGNGNTCTATVTVQDNTLPSVTCKNHTVALSAAGTASIVPTNVFQSGSDNCGTVNLVSVSPNSFTCANLSQNTVTLTVNDGNGNGNTCTATVTVQDNIPPSVTCKNHAAVLSAAGAVGIVPSNVFQSGSDNCGTVNLTEVSPNSFTCANLGQNIVTLTVNDGNGNTNTCTATVTVQDNTPPQPVCKNHAVVLDQNGSASIAPSDVFQSGTDNCGTVNPASVSPNSFACTQVGPVTVTLTVNDGNGNTATCTASVNVSDNQPPTITCPANIVRNTDPNQCTAVVFYANPTVSDNCSNWVLTRTGGLASTAAFPLGTSMVEWKVTDPGNNTAICQFTVTVNDAQAPVITCPASLVRSNDAGHCSAVVSYTSPTATDNCGSVSVSHVSGGTSGSQFPKGTTVVVWKATDTASPTVNMATCSFTVTVNDTQQPGITCPANQTVGNTTGSCGATVNYATPAYSDNCMGGGAALQSGLPSGGVFPKGQTTVVWRATDAVGLTKTCSFRVTVNDTEAPVITCPASQSANTSPSSCTVNVTYTTPTATDNCPGAVTVVRIGGPASGGNFPLGSTNVVWRAIDGAGRSSTCSFSVTVADATPPVITCPQSIAVTGSGSPCMAVATYATPSATDNCGVQSVFLLSGFPSGATFPAGETVNTWRAVDNVGLSHSCSFTVTVNCGANSEQGGVSREPSAPETSVDALQTLAFSLAPNPAQDEVRVSIENLGTTGGELAVYDAQGRLMWQQVGIAASPSHLLTLSVLDFPAGVYFVTLWAEGQMVTKRLVVARN